MAQLNIRIDDELKERVEDILKTLNISATDAISGLYEYIDNYEKLPFIIERKVIGRDEVQDRAPKMIKFKDFRDDRETYNRGADQAVIEMNNWVTKNNVNVISIETISTVLGTMARTSSHFDSVRVWYKE